MGGGRVRLIGNRSGIELATTTAKTGYAPVNGLQMYYEIHGTGQPLVLLHGGLSAIGTSFGSIHPADARGHGREP
jgi:pimeloyl-ACP methyl ester carboxylesterase